MSASTWHSKRALCALLEVGLVSCTALPGGSLDPLVPVFGLPRQEQPPHQPSRGTPTPAEPLGPKPISESYPSREAPRLTAWSGRYRDNRGEGEIGLTLTQEESALGGTWRLRTGGAGTFAGSLASDGRTLSFSMRGGDRQCPTTIEGIAEYAGERIRARYQGTDCQGTVADGRLDLHKQ